MTDLSYIRQSQLYKRTRAELLRMLLEQFPEEYRQFAEDQVRKHKYRFGVYGYNNYTVPDDYDTKAPTVIEKQELVEFLYRLLPADHPDRRLVAPEQCRARDMSHAELARIAKQNHVDSLEPGPHNQNWINAIFNANPHHQIFSRAPENLTPKHALEEFCLLIEQKKVIVGPLMKRAEFLLRTAFPKSRLIDDLFWHYFSNQARWSLRTPSRREALFHMLEMLTLEQEHFGQYLEKMELEDALKEAEAGADELGLV